MIRLFTFKERKEIRTLQGDLDSLKTSIQDLETSIKKRESLTKGFKKNRKFQKLVKDGIKQKKADKESHKQSIKTHEKKIKKLEKRVHEIHKTAEKVIPVVVLMVLFAVFGAVMFTERLGFTGLIIGESLDTYTLNIDETYTENSEYTFVPEGPLHSLSVSGSIIGNGTVRMYLTDGTTTYTILDSEEEGLTMITGMTTEGEEPPEEEPEAEEEAEEDEEPAEEEPEEEEPVEEEPPEEEPAEEEEPEEEPTEEEIPEEEPEEEEIEENITEEEEPEVNVTEEPVEENITEEINETINITEEEPIEENVTEEEPEEPEPEPEEEPSPGGLPPEEEIRRFSDICLETCLLPDLNVTNYTIIIEIVNATLEFDTITYTVLAEANVSANETLNETINITINETVNITLNITNITEPVNITNISLNITLNETINITLPIISNLTGNLTANITNITEEILTRVVINGPVIVVQKIKLDGPANNITIKVPKWASNFDVTNITLSNVTKPGKGPKDKEETEENTTQEINETINTTEEQPPEDNLTQEPRPEINETEEPEEEEPPTEEPPAEEPPEPEPDVPPEDEEIEVVIIPEEPEGLSIITGEIIAEEMVDQIGIWTLFTRFFRWLFSGEQITGFVVENVTINKTGQVDDENITLQIITEEPIEELVLEYELPGPTSTEERIDENKKRFTVSSPIHYENVLSYMSVPDVPRTAIKIYWLKEIENGTGNETNITIRRVDVTKDPLYNLTFHDTNNNSYVDLIEWNIPHLSNQTFEIIIVIIKAEHLDIDRNYISDIYDDVKKQDDIWSEEIYPGEYVRVTFEEPLDKSKDITIYARSNIPNGSNASSRINVYTKDSDTLITTFENITGENWSKVYLTELNGTHDVFDLRVLGNAVEFDYIVDPSPSTKKWYLQWNADFTDAVAKINLSATQDSTVNQNDRLLKTASQLYNFVNATSPVVGGSGIVIASGGLVNFSSYFTCGDRIDAVYATWKLYKLSGTTETLICKKGNDDTTGVQLPDGTASTLKGSCTASSTTTLNSTDKLRLYLNTWAETIGGGGDATKHAILKWDTGDFDSWVQYEYYAAGTPYSVSAGLYKDAAHTQGFRFYDKADTIYIRSFVYDVGSNNVTGATVVANFTVGGAVEKSITLTNTVGATYNGSWETNSSTTPGVYTVNITANKSSVNASGVNYTHIYNTSNVAAYSMDYDDDGTNESIMENKHLISVYDTSAQLKFLYSKDEDVSYNFTDISGIDGRGQISGTEGSATIVGVELSATGEGLTSAKLVGNASFSSVDNEVIITGLLSNFTVWEYNTSSGGYDVIVNYDPPLDIQEVFIGDVDNDGENEVLSTSSFNDGIAVWDYNPATKQLEHIWNLSSLAADFNDGAIGNLDTDSYIEFAAIPDSGGSDLVIFYNDTAGATSFSNISIYLTETPQALEAASMDGDDELELFSQAADKLRVWDYNSTSGGYDNTINITSVNNVVDHIDSGDLTGDGIPNLITCGNGGNVSVINYSDGAYSVIWTSDMSAYEPHLSNMQSCAVGDFDNDGDNDIMGDVRYDQDSPYVWYWVMWSWNGSTFEEVWNSSQIDARTSGVLMGEVTEAGDFDNDGYIEFGVGDAGYDGLNNWTVYASETGSVPLSKEFSSGESLTSGHANIVVGDIDNDALSGGASLQFNISMTSEDVDYLEYKLHNFSSTGNKTLYTAISGAINISSDERYHLENGTDALVSSLTAGAWTKYTSTQSNYSLIYDNDTTDNFDNSVIAWIRFNETSNIDFNATALWNDSTGVGSIKILHNISNNTNASDVLISLLVFSNGTNTTIDQWMPTIKTGSFPATNFLTAPAAGGENTVPTTPTVTISTVGNSNTSDEDLNCSATLNDSDADTLNVTVNWTKNGVFNRTDYYNNSYDNGTLFNATLGSGNTSVGDIWNCSMRLDDGTNQSGWGNSSTLEISGELTAPTDPTTAAYTIEGSVSGVLSGGSTSTTNEIINFTHTTYGKRLDLYALFTTQDVNLASLVITASSKKTAISLTGVTGIGTNHTIYVPTGGNEGLYVCPDATTLNGVHQGCSNKVEFTHAEATKGTWTSNIKASIEGSNYKIQNLTSTGGAGDITPPRISWPSPTPDDGERVGSGSVYLNTTVTDGSNTSAFYDWNKSLIAYWSMDFYNSTGVYDNSTYDDFGEFGASGPSTADIIAGKYGSALDFDGDNDYVDAASDGIAHDEYSISMWIYENAAPSSSDYSLIGRKSGTGQGRNWIAIDNDGSLCGSANELFSYLGGSATCSDFIFSAQTWYHVVLVWNTTNVSMYVNGDQQIVRGETEEDATGNWIIGKHQGFAIDYFNGTLDEITIFNRVLSPEEINASFNNTAYDLYHNFTSLADGNYNYSAYAIDEQGNLNITAERNVTVGLACGGTITASYTLTENLTCTGTAVIIGADDITLDCAGYTINYSTAGAAVGYGVNNTGYANVTVQNCNIIEGNATTNAKMAIQFDGAQNGTIYNNNITTQGQASYAINLVNTATSNNITGNTITTTGVSGYGVAIASSSDSNNVTSNIITTSNGAAFGMNIATASNTIAHNTLTVTGASNYGIFLSAATSNNITNNTVNVTQGLGIYLESASSSSNITENNITSNHDGVYLSGSSSSCRVINNTITVSGASQYGIMSTSSNSQTIENNTVTTTGSAGDGIRLVACSDSTVTRNTINASDADAILIFGGSDNNNITDNNIIEAGDDGLVLDGALADPNNNNFTNNTLSNIGSNDLEVVDAGLDNNYFTDQVITNYNIAGAGSLLHFANSSAGKITFLEAINGSGTDLSAELYIHSNKIHVNGSNSDLNKSANLTFYSITGTGTQRPHRNGAECPTNVCADLSKSGTTYSFNVTGFTNYSLEDVCNLDITASKTLTYGYSCTGTALKIAADDITIDCDYNWLNYSTAGTLGYGINNTGGYDNITIQNCKIKEKNATTNAKYGIYFQGVVNSTINNTNITTIGNYSYGVLLYISSINNNVSNVKITTSGYYGTGIMVSTSCTQNNVSYNTVTTNEERAQGITIDNSDNNTISHNTITTNEFKGYGIRISFSDYINITDNNATTEGDDAHSIYLGASSNCIISDNRFYNTLLILNSDAIYIDGASQHNQFTDNRLYPARDGIRLTVQGGYPSYNNFTDNKMFNVRSKWLNIVDANIGSTWLIDQNIETYTIGGAGSWLNFKNSTAGIIDFTQAISGTGDNLGADIYIHSNEIYVNGSKAGLNKSADLRFFNVAISGTGTPFRNGAICPLNVCGAISNTSNNYTFNVTGFTTYSVGNVSCGDTVVSSTTLTEDLVCPGTALRIGADDITLDCDYYSINYSTSSVGFGINNTAGYDGLTVKNCNINEKGQASSYAVFLNSSTSGNISNNNITTAEVGSHAIYLNGSSGSNNITNNTIVTGADSARGINVYSSDSNRIIQNNITTSGGENQEAIYLDSSDSTTAENNSIKTSGTESHGLTITSSSSSTIKNNSINVSDGAAMGFYIYGNSDNNVFEKNDVVKAGSDGIVLQVNGGAYPENNNFTNNTFSNIGDDDLQMTNAGINGTWLIDQPIAEYNIAGAGGIIYFKNSTAGVLKFLEPINGSGVNLSDEINITNNLIEVNSTKSGLNKSANLTFYSISVSGTELPFRNGAMCPVSICGNFQNTDTTYYFNVTQFSNYSIGNLTCGSTLDRSITLEGNLTCPDTGLNIGANSIYLNCSGYTINYSTSSFGYAINNTAGYDSVTIQNCILYEGNAAPDNKHTIYFVDSQNSIIDNNTITTQDTNSDALYLTNTSTSNITNNTIITAGSNADAFYIYGNSDSNLFKENTISQAVGDAIRLDASGSDIPNNNNFTNNTFSSISGNDLNILDAGIDGTWLIDQTITDYTIAGAGSFVNFKNSSAGMVEYTAAISGTGTNLSDEINITSNLIEVNGSNSGLNKSANLTFYAVTVIGTPAPFRNSVLCSDTICGAIDNDGSTYYFNVTEFTNYSVGNNSGPSVAYVNLTPTNATSSDDLIVNATCTDSNETNLIAYYELYADDVNQTSLAGSYAVENNTNTNITTIDSSETTKNEKWYARVKCSDGFAYSAWTNSSNVTIGNTAPEAPTLITPTEGNITIHDRTPLFNWTGTDPDGDPLTYNIAIWSGTACNSDRNVSGIDDSNYTPSSELCTADEVEGDGLYYWKVRANDGTANGSYSATWNFSIEPWVIINLTQETISFGTMVLGQINDTTNDDPAPMEIQNDGNVLANLVNITTNASIWTSTIGALGTQYWQIKAGNSSEADSFNWTASTTSWANITDTNQSIIQGLNYNNSKDQAELEVRLEVPGDEPSGSKKGYIIFWWEQAPSS